MAVPGTVAGPSWPPGSPRQKSVGGPVLATVTDEAASPLQDTAGYWALGYVQESRVYGTHLAAAAESAWKTPGEAHTGTSASGC